jgi:hypothetical protein
LAARQTPAGITIKDFTIFGRYAMQVPTNVPTVPTKQFQF